MKVGKKYLIIALVICLIVSVIGISFAYFVSSVNSRGSGSNVNANTAELVKVSYDAGTQTLDLENAIPGDSDSKFFTVTVTPTASENSASYTIVLNLTTNEFINSAIRYTLRDNTSVLASRTLEDNQTGRITLYTDTKTVSSETDYNYTLEVEFVETNTDQNENINKSLNGIVEVEFS